MSRLFVFAPVLIHLFLLSATAPLDAQSARTPSAESTSSAESTPSPATPLAPGHHWALDAARRLAGAGLVDTGYDPATATVSLGELATLFARAAERAEDRPGLRALARAYGRRLEEEFPGLTGAEETAFLRFVGGSAEAAFRHRTGVVLASAVGPDQEPIGVGALEDRLDALLALPLFLGAGRHAALSVTPTVGRGAGLRSGHLVVSSGPVSFWAGRRAVGFGPAEGGGIVLDDGDRPGSRVALDGGGVLVRPFRLPWILERMGPLRLETSLHRLDHSTFPHPWLLAMRARIAPHPRIGFGVSRATMFGGEGNVSLPFDRFLLAMMGVRPEDEENLFDNQILSLDLWLRPPVGDLPLVAYAEVGMDDSAGAVSESPGITAGVEMTSVPGIPELALGLEATWFGVRSPPGIAWYQHGGFHEGWTVERRLLGHPLGGHGRELLVTGRLDALDARLLVEGRGFVRDREPENLYAPERIGSSAGGALEVRYRPTSSLELGFSGQVETGGRDWSQSDVRVRLSWIF